METKFQTSFIPKKPMPANGAAPTISMAPRPPHRGSSIFFNLAILAFVVSLGAAGAVFAWKIASQKVQEGDKAQLADLQQKINPQLINDLKISTTKIHTAQDLLRTHVALSKLFGIIAKMTVDRVRFTSLEVIGLTDQSSPTAPSKIQISLEGQGASLAVLAFQSNVLNSLDTYGLSNVVQSPSLDIPTLDPTKTVNFTLKATVDPSSVSYEDLSVQKTQ